MSADVSAYEWTRPVRLLAEGKAVISVGGSYEARTLAEAFGVPIDELWDHVGFMPVPAGPADAPASVAGSMSYAIFRQAAQPQLAMRVLESAVAPEALARLARATGPDAGAAVGGRAGRARACRSSRSRPRSSSSAVTRPQIPLYPRVSTQLQAMLEATLTGGSSRRGRGEADGGADRSDHGAAGSCTRSTLRRRRPPSPADEPAVTSASY